MTCSVLIARSCSPIAGLNAHRQARDVEGRLVTSRRHHKDMGVAALRVGLGFHDQYLCVAQPARKIGRTLSGHPLPKLA